MLTLLMIALANSVQDAVPVLESGLPEQGERFLMGWALIFVATALVALPMIKALLRAQIPIERVFFARWGFTHVATVALTILAGLLLVGASVRYGWVKVDSLFPTLLVGSLPLVAGAVGVAHFARRFHPEKLEALGWRLDARAFRAVSASLLGYGALLPALFGVGILWSIAAPYLGYEYELQGLLVDATELKGSDRLFALLLMAGLVPFLEEWLFRGFLQPLLVQNLRETGGIVVTSIIFAALHGGSAFMPVFCLSLYLGLVQLQGHRLLATWAVHAAHNAVTLMIVWSVPESLELFGS